jgi:hypothetical protein
MPGHGKASHEKDLSMGFIGIAPDILRIFRNLRFLSKTLPPNAEKLKTTVCGK